MSGRFFVLFLFLFCDFLRGFDMQSAVELALQNSDELKAQEYFVAEKMALKNTNAAKFLPKINISYQGNTSSIKDTRGKKFSANLGVNASLNLFNGFADIYAQNAANFSLKAQEHTKNALKEDLALFVKIAYIDILRRRQEVQVFTQAVDLLAEQYRVASEFHRVGLIPKNDVLSVQVEQGSAKQDLLSAQAALNSAQNTLSRYIKTQIPLSEFAEVELKEAQIIEEKLQEQLEQNRSELKVLNATIKEAKEQESIARAAFLPSVSANANGIKYLDSISENEANFMLVANLNIFNGFSDTNILEARSVRTLALNSQKADILAQMKLELSSAILAYELALSAYKVAKIAQEQAEEGFRIAQNRYKERILSTRDFLDAQLLLTKAKSSVVLNRYAIIETIAALERIIESEMR